MAEAIFVKDLSLSFKRGRHTTQALQGISFSIEQGKTIGIVGSSGCGKSTLLRILAGVYTHYEGTVRILGEAPNPKKHSFALVPQHFALLPWKSVRENILLPILFGKKESAKTSLDEVSKRLGIEDLLSRYPLELSGGQQQRVALARALLQDPDFLFLDEPFSALDVFNASQCKDLLQGCLQKGSNPTTILVSHNLEEVEELCDSIIFMQGNPGRVYKTTEKVSASELRKQLTTKPTVQ